MRKKLKGAVIFCVVLWAAVLILSGCGGGSPADELDQEIRENAEYILKTVPNPSSGSAGGEWAVKGVKDSGIEVEDQYYSVFFDNIRALVKSKGGVLSETWMTEYARTAIGLVSIGKDPSSVEGYDLLSPLDDYEAVTNQGVNAAAFALIASNISGVRLKNEDRLVDFIVDGLDPEKSGTAVVEYGSDYLSIAMEGLSFYRDRDEVKSAVEKAAEELASLQTEDGGFGSCESTAEAVCALSQIGIDVVSDIRFSVNDRSPLDALMEYKRKGGGFCHEKGDGHADPMASEKGLMALNAVRLRREGKPLYKGMI